jgi:membrane protease YdiL (CAAX protease family)
LYGAAVQERSGPRPPRWGLGDALAGYVVGYLALALAVGIWARASGLRPHGGTYPLTPGVEVAQLLGLWLGLAGAPLVACRLKGSGRMREDFGLALSPWPDLAVGALAGLGSQWVLVPLVYLPIRPLVPGLDRRLGAPAHQLVGSASGAGLVLVALLVCVGAPVVEELFFRGLLLRALERRLGGLRAGPALSVGASAVLFALAHYEALQLAGLLAFGVVLALLARGFGRLGPGIVAHACFNAVTVVSVVRAR